MKNDFEHRINQLIIAINKSGRGFGWQNHPNRTHAGRYIDGEPFDFVILSDNYNCVFDAKMTILDNYKIEKKDIKQAQNLFNCYRYSQSDAFFLIYFHKEKKYRKLHIIDFLNLLNVRKNIKYTDCEEFRLERMFIK